MIKIIGPVLLFVNFINSAFINFAFITSIYFLLKRLPFFKCFIPLFLFVFLQAFIIENTERTIQNCFYIFHLTVLYALLFKLNFGNYRNTFVYSILLCHLILLLYFFITGNNFGRVKEGGAR